AVWHILWHGIILTFFHLAWSILRMSLACIVWPFKAIGMLVRRRRAAREWLENATVSEASRNASEDSRRRRENARVQCEVLFQLHTHTLGERFPKAVYDEFVKRYLGDDRTPVDVEQRAKQLQDAILEHVAQIEPPKTPYTIESLTDWYKKTKKQIEDLTVDDRYKQAQLAQLNARFAELTQALMETLHP